MTLACMLVGAPDVVGASYKGKACYLWAGPGVMYGRLYIWEFTKLCAYSFMFKCFQVLLV